MELFKEYMKEREGCEILVLEDGFLTARVEVDDTNKKYLFINDFFVSKKNRTKARHTAIKLLSMAKEVAIKAKCTRMCGIIYTDTLNATESLKANLYYGYKVMGVEAPNKIYVETSLDKVNNPMRAEEKKNAKK